MVRSFRDRDTERGFQRRGSGRLPADVQRVALRRLVMLDAAETLADLRVPPGNRLEKLSGDREGEHGVPINHRWRICFVWKEGDAHQVEIVDYH